MRKQPPPCYAVGAVIYRCDAHGQIEVLLIKKKHGGWSLPKGTIRPGETNLEALAREVAEETTLTGTIGAFLQEVIYTVVKRGQLRLKSVRYYLVYDVVGTPRPSGHERIRKVRWFRLSTAIQLAHNDRVCTVLEYTGVALTTRATTMEHLRLVERSIGR
jgi:8-oxo-dGTP pyrophosphatase MutT (NUDIX family)